jgi:hypothetical protein
MRSSAFSSTGGKTKGKQMSSLLKSKSTSQLPQSTMVSKVPLVPHIPLGEPWLLEYAFDEEHISFPLKLLFHDYLYKHPLTTIDLKGWILSHQVFLVMSQSCQDMTSLCLDHCRGVTFECLDVIRGLKQLRHLSLNKVCVCVCVCVCSIRVYSI